MGFNLKSKIWGLFSAFFIRNDSFTSGGTGLNQRFIESLAEDFDNNSLDKISGLSTLNDPFNTDFKFIQYLESELGNPIRINTSEYTRRKIVNIANQIYNIKGTKKSYDILLKMLGFETVTITESYPSYRFDQGVRFDHPVRRFDTDCQGCSPYSIALTGELSLTDTIRQTIFRIDDFLSPINAQLDTVTVNGDELTWHLISLEIDENGDLIYDNTSTPELVIYLQNGDIIIEGPSSDKYFLYSNGDLIYIP